MIPMTEAEIRRSFVNCSQGEAKRLKQPDRVQPVETLSTEARIERVQANLDTFVRRVVDAA